MRKISITLGIVNSLLIAFSVYAIIDVISTMPAADALWGLVGLILIASIYSIILIIQLSLVILIFIKKQFQENKYFMYSYVVTWLMIVVMAVVIVTPLIITRG